MNVYDSGVNIQDLEVGCVVASATGLWLVTDVGSRTLVAIPLSQSIIQGKWHIGPPYAIAETVWDEYEQERLRLILDAKNRITEPNKLTVKDFCEIIEKISGGNCF